LCLEQARGRLGARGHHVDDPCSKSSKTLSKPMSSSY